MTAPQYLTVAEAADMARLSIRYIRLLVQQGTIPAARMGKVRGVRILKDDFEAWLTERAGGTQWHDQPASRRFTSVRTGDGQRN